MSNKTLYISNPSESLLTFVRALKEDKDRMKKELIERKELYFKK